MKSDHTRGIHTNMYAWYDIMNKFVTQQFCYTAEKARNVAFEADGYTCGHNWYVGYTE